MQRRTTAFASSLLGLALACAVYAQEPKTSPTPPPSPAPTPSPSPLPSPGAPAEEALPPVERMELRAKPTPGAPTIGLAPAVATALEQNFGLLAAADSRQSAVFREGAVRAEFYPKFTPRYSKSSDQSVVGLDASQKLPWTGGSIVASGAYTSGTPGASTPDSSDIHVTLTQPLLRGFGPAVTNFDLTNSQRARQTQERSYELARQQLAIDVTAGFYQVIRQRQLLEVARQSLKRSEGLRDASAARMQVGLASRLDVLRAELQAAQAQDAMVSSEAALQNALEQFRVLLALPPGSSLEPEEVSLPETLVAQPEPLEVLVARALENRLELRESQDLVTDAERTYKVTRQSLLPQLDVNVGFIQTGAGFSFSDTFRTPLRQTSVFFSTSYPVERTADRANKAVAALDLEARKRAQKQKRLDIEAEVRAAVRNLERIRKSVELQRLSVELAEQQHRLATLRYQRGLASNFDVVDAEGSLVQARSALVGLLTDDQVARLQLEKATGTLDVAKEFVP